MRADPGIWDDPKEETSRLDRVWPAEFCAELNGVVSIKGFCTAGLTSVFTCVGAGRFETVEGAGVTVGVVGEGCGREGVVLSVVVADVEAEGLIVCAKTWPQEVVSCRSVINRIEMSFFFIYLPLTNVFRNGILALTKIGWDSGQTYPFGSKLSIKHPILFFINFLIILPNSFGCNNYTPSIFLQCSIPF